VAGNAARQRLLITARHGVKRNIYTMCKLKRIHCCQRVFYGVKRNIAANESHFWDYCRNVGHFLCGLARVKRYVNFYLHLYRQQPEMNNQNVDFAYPWKNFADAHACVICVYNLTYALYFAINNHFCVIRIPFVPASRLACH